MKEQRRTELRMFLEYANTRPRSVGADSERGERYR